MRKNEKNHFYYSAQEWKKNSNYLNKLKRFIVCLLNSICRIDFEVNSAEFL